MKRIVQISLGGLFLLTLLATTCEEEKDPCKDTKMEQELHSYFYCWGSAKFIVFNTGADVTKDFKGTHFKVKYYKVHCGGNTSTIFENLYYMMEDGTLDKIGSGQIGFTWENTQDKFVVQVYVVTPFGDGDVRITSKVVTKSIWEKGDLKAEMSLRINTDELGNAMWGLNEGSISFQ